MKKPIMSKDKSVDKSKFTSYQIIVVALLALTQFSVVLDFMVISGLIDIINAQIFYNH